MFKSFLNTDNYVSVDQLFQKEVNYFVRKMKIEAKEDAEGYVDKSDVYES